MPTRRFEESIAISGEILTLGTIDERSAPQMSQHNPEGFPEGDWDERGDLSWNEFDWRQFLLRRGKEVERFASLYQIHCHEMDHLDHVAQQMGWQAEDWSVADFEGESDDLETTSGVPGEDGSDSLDGDPYTLHRHPVFIVTRALFGQLDLLVEALCAVPGIHLRVRPKRLWALAGALSSAEREMLLALQSLDMGDFMLAVIHFKLAHQAISDTMTHLEGLADVSGAADEFRLEARVRLFDLREVCLRVMNDCREEDRRNFRDPD
jgi:hypothetical protein